MSRRLLVLAFLVVFLAGGVHAQDNTLEVISPENITQLSEIARWSDAGPSGLVWSPDNQTLAVGTSADIRLYNTDEPDMPPLIVDSSYAARHQFNATGDLVLNSFQAWDATTGELVTPDWYGDISPSGRYGVTVKEGEGIETAVQVWDIQNLDRPFQVFETGSFDPTIPIIGVKISPDEQTIAVLLSSEWHGQFNPRGAINGQLWNIQNGTLITTFDMPEGGSVEFSSDGAWLVSNSAVMTFESGSSPGEVNIWDTRTGNSLATIGSTNAWSVIMLNSSQLAVSLSSGEFVVWNNNQQFTLPGVDYSRPLAFSPDGQRLVVATDNWQIVIWDLTQRTQIALNHDASNAVFSPNSQFFVTRDQNNDFHLWDATNGSLLASLGHLDEGIDAIFSPDSTRLALGSLFSFDGMSSLWDTENPSEPLYRFAQPVQINSDWTRGAYWDVETSNVRVIDLATGNETELVVLPDHLGFIYHFDTANEHALFSKDHETIRWVNLRTGDVEATFSFTGRSNFHVSPNGEYLAVEQFPDDFSEPANLILVDLTRPEREPVPINSTAELWNLQFSPDGSLLALNSRDTGFVELWDTATATLLATWYTSEWLVNHTFSPDGKWLVTTSYDSPVMVWDIEATLKTASPEVEGALRLSFDISAFGTHGSPVIFSENSDKFVVQVDSGVYVNDRRQGGLVVLDLAAGLASEEAVITLEEGDTLFAPNAQTGPSLLSPNGSLLVANNQEKEGVFVWDTESGQQLLPLGGMNPYIFVGLGEIGSVFSPDGRLLAHRLSGGAIVWWDTDTLISGADEPITTQSAEGWGEIGFNRYGTLLFQIDNRGIGVWGVTR